MKWVRKSGRLSQQKFAEEPSEISQTARDHGVSPRGVVRGLDTLRFITAMWVAFYHGARFPVNRVISPDSTIDRFFLLIGNTTWNGTAAVTVFFLISGFLIHVGNVGRSRVNVPTFWLRRGIRIGLPLLVTIVIVKLLGSGYVRVLDGILWTVYAEIAYYLLYPLFLPLIFRYGVAPILTVSLIISLAMIASRPNEIYLFGFGLKATWLFNAPLWLMGCYLAERRDEIGQLAGRIPLWLLRSGVIFYCYGSTILANHLTSFSIGYTWTIWPFGMYCMLWLDAEMRRGTGRATFPIFERFGLAGYSLYLTHKVPIHFVQSELGYLSPVSSWFVTLGGVAVTTWAFYRLIEWPAHKLARSFGRSHQTKSNAV